MSLLSYKIIDYSSEDRMHPVRELQDFHAQSRGWQSARWCDFPQFLVLRFNARVTLQQVQVLSHQFKIASRVEIMIGDMPPGMRQPINGAEGVEYTRLGHFSLDSNERSGYQARELKTVYVPSASEGCYLKLLLHKCHVNEHNLYNQIGLLAVRAIGTGPGAHGDGPAVPVEPLALQQAANASPPPKHQPAPHEVRGSAMDPAVVAMINELQEQKLGAVAAEDFDEAKRLKARVVELREIGVRLADLERQKTQAISNEDYDLAKELKQQLHEMRESGGMPPAALDQGGSNSNLGPSSRSRATTQAAHEERVVGQAVADLAEQPQASGGDLPPPEPLSASDEKDAAPLIDAFGEHLVRCLYSRVWNLRQHAVGEIERTLPNLRVDGRTLVHAVCRVVTRCAADKMVQVYLAAMHLFVALFQQPAVTALPRSEWAQLTSPLTPTLISKLGDGNHRVKDASEAALLVTCRLPQLGPHPVLSLLLAPLKPAQEKDVRLQMGRLGLLQSLLAEFGEALRDQMRDITRSIKPSLESSKDTVRTKATQVAIDIYAIVGSFDAMKAYLSTLSATTRENVLIALERASGEAPLPDEHAMAAPTAPPLAHDYQAADGGEIEPTGEDETVCQFCGAYDPAFAVGGERLDMHYWKECPMLTSCGQCGQVIEVLSLNQHLVEECDQGQEFRYEPPLGSRGFTGCPLCLNDLGPSKDTARQHLCFECPSNPRLQPDGGADD